MSECKCSAIVHDGAWREALWKAAFGEAKAPIKNIIPTIQPENDGVPATFVFMDKSRISTLELKRLSSGVAKHFGTPETDVYAEMEREEIPVRVDEHVKLIGCRMHSMATLRS